MLIELIKKNNKLLKSYSSLLLILILLSSTLLTISCTKQQEIKTEEESQQLIKTAKVIKGDITREITLVGFIEPKEKKDLFFEFEGIINYLYKVGDKVKEGEVLAKINSSSLKDALSEKQTGLDEAKYEYDKVLTDNHFFEINAEKNKSIAKKTYEIAKRAYANSLKTKEDKLTLEIAKINYENALIEIEKQKQDNKYSISQAQEKLNDAQINFNEAKLNLEEKTKIYAPFNCQIVSIEKEDNQLIAANETVLTVADYEDFIVKVHIDEKDISQISENMDVNITLDAYPDKELTGKLKDISPVAKVTSSGVFYEAVVDILNKADLENISGLTAEIDIILEGKKNILIIPEVAIKEVAGKKIVEIRNEDKSITQIEIKTGITDYTYTEVISGLNEGDEVVISK